MKEKKLQSSITIEPIMDAPVQSEQLEEHIKIERHPKRFSQKATGRFNKWMQDEVIDVQDEIHSQQVLLQVQEEYGAQEHYDEQEDYGDQESSDEYELTYENDPIQTAGDKPLFETAGDNAHFPPLPKSLTYGRFFAKEKKEESNIEHSNIFDLNY